MKIAHQTSVQPEATNVGARYRMRCAAGDAVTPLMSRQAAELAAERHQWEHEGGAMSPQRQTGKSTRRARRGRSV